MSEQNLELIKTRTLFLKEGVKSGEIVLVDDIGGNMFFSFLLKYVHEGTEGKTQFQVLDDFHAMVTIETRPSAITKLKEPLEIGTYQQSKVLYLDVVVEPCTALGEDHNVTISFYINK